MTLTCTTKYSRWNRTVPIRVILIATLIYTLSPLLVIFFSGLWFYRCFLILWKEHWHPRFGPLLDSYDSVLVNESPYAKEQLSNIGYYAKIEGRIDLEDFRSVVQKGLERYDKNDESRSSRKLRQVLKRWGGFYIGEDERDFSLKDHVRLLNIDEINQRVVEQCDPKTDKLCFTKIIHEENLTEDDVSELNWSLIRIPYKKHTAPWEILLLYNPDPAPESRSDVGKNGKWTTVLFLRAHHSFGDGVALTCFFSHFLDQNQEYSVGRTLNHFSHQTVKTSRLRNLFSMVKNVMDFVLGVPAFISHGLTFFDRSWPPVTLDMKEARPAHTFTFEFPKSKFLDIQKHSDKNGRGKVRSTTLLMATASLSFSQFFKEYSKKVWKDSSGSILPKNVYITDNLGVPRERNQLTNRLTVIAVKLPFGSVQTDGQTDCIKMVKELEEGRSLAKNRSRTLKVEQVCVFLLGLIPVSLRPTIFLATKAFGMSYVPSFENPVTILGQPVVSVRAVGILPEVPYVYLTFHISHEKIHGTLAVAKKVIESRPEAHKLAKCFEKKFDDIYQDLTQN